MSNRDWAKTLEIEAPLAKCGHCGFATALTGEFSVEDGRLVWRGASDVQPRRGPDLESCCESDPVAEFEHVDADGKLLAAEDIVALRATARAAQEAEMAEWARARD